MSNVKILVISDLHAISCHGERTDSHLFFEGKESDWGNSLINYIKELELTIDVLICAGDIANKANKLSFENGWSFINQLKEELGISHLLCVPGNHDHQSRDGKDFSPKHQLQFCAPIFPLDCVIKNTHFWAWNWTHVESNLFNSVLINTSAYHGYMDEFKHGRVAVEVSNQISDFLRTTVKEKPFNIMVCHHHPEKMEYVDGDYDVEVMEGGGYLLRKIEEADVGPWLIVHGHKHFASITYAKSGCSAPSTILSAGSVSAKLNPNYETRTSNQFYIVDINLEETEKSGKLKGQFNTFEWSIQRGWGPSRSQNLPAQGGFGSSVTNKEIITKVKELLSENGPFLEEFDLKEIHQMTTHVPPDQFKLLISKLFADGYHVTLEQNKIIEVGEACE
ncbi:MAG: metallophosphoesterase superfamily enzyme [Patiriisocius sp.]|jgi:metallophosphoesterase superfamily enzyme